MRKLNVRFFLFMTAGFVLFVGGLFAVHHFQHDRIAAAELWQANNARQAEKFDKAAAHYERYLEFEPDDAAVMTTYAEMLEQDMEAQPLGSRNPRKIVYLLEEALKHQSGRDDLRRRVVKYYLYPRMRRFKDAETHLDILQRTYAEDGSLWQQRAICQENTGQYEAAAESLRQATRFPPDQIHGYELLAAMLRRHLNRYQQADAVIKEMMTRHADSPEAYLARARYNLEFGLGDIASDAAEAIRLAPDNPEAILLHARALQQNNKVAEAAAQLERGLKLYPNDPRMIRHLAWIEYFQNKRDSARERLQAGIINCPDAFDLHTALAELLIQGKMFDQVQKIIAEMKAKGVREERITYLTARIAVERGQWTEAIGLLEKLRPEARPYHDLSVQINILLAHSYKQLGDTERELESLKHVLEHDVQSIPARLGIASLYASSNRIGEAIKEYEQLMSLPGAPASAAVDMVRLIIVRKKRTPAEKPTWPEIEQLITTIERRYPTSSEIVLAKSDLLAAQGKQKEAATMLADACANSNDPRLWMQSAQTAEQADGSGLAVLDDAVKHVGDLPEFRLKRAALLISRSATLAHVALKELELAPQALTEEQRARQIKEKLPPGFTDDQKTQLLVGLGELYFTIQDYANARRLFQKVAADHAGDLHVRILLIEIALRENDRDSLPALFTEARRLEPPGGTIMPMLEVRYQLALAESGDHSAAEKARTLLETIKQQRPAWPLVHECLGRLAEVDDDKPRAIDCYRQAIELGDAEMQTHHRLIRLLVEARREKDAEEVLARVKQQGNMPLARQRSMIASVSPLLQNSVVQQFVQQSITKSNSDPDELEWLGKMMWDTGDHDKALAAFRAAVAQGGHIPDRWVTLVKALASDRKLDEAKQAMEEARKRLPPDLAARTIANCFEILQQYEDALREYQQALKDQPNDSLLLRRYVHLLLNLGRIKDAIAKLTEIVAKPGSLAKDDVAWARRNLAMLGTMERKPEQYVLAYKLLGQNEAELGPNLEDMRAQVVLLTQQPPRAGEETPPRRRALQLLEKIVQYPDANRDDHFALAKLYDAERNWVKAEKEYRFVIAADPKNPMPIALFARRLLQLGKLTESAQAVQQVDKLAPGTSLAANLRSRLQFQTGETERLLADLTSFANRDPHPAEKADREFLAGSLLDEFTRSTTNPHPESRGRLREAAVTFYERSIRFHPESVVRMVALWSHTGEMEAALRWLHDPRMKIPLNLRASAEIAALRASHANETQCLAVEKWLREAAAEHPEITLDLHMADLAELRHDFKTAEQLYRKVLKKDENQPVVMNNLAWVLANIGPSVEALALAQKSIAMVGPVPDLLDTRARAFLALGRSSEAIQDMEDAINDSPTALRYFQLAVAEEMNANSAGAQDAFQHSVQLGIDSRDLHPVDLPVYARLKSSHLP
jgi:tetratricopeptide (TPR) repeat protein